MLWTATPEWRGERCFIVCGGESVREHDLSRLRGRRVIAINSSIYTLHKHGINADFLVFSDERWWKKHHVYVTNTFHGRVVTVTPMRASRHYLLMERQRSGGLSPRADHLAVWHTTTCPATNLAAHLGASQVNYLGLDGKGGWHHDRHPVEWREVRDKFKYHEVAIRALEEPLRLLGVEWHNASPVSTYDFIPHRSYEEMLSWPETAAAQSAETTSQTPMSRPSTTPASPQDGSATSATVQS